MTFSQFDCLVSLIKILNHIGRPKQRPVVKHTPSWLLRHRFTCRSSPYSRVVQESTTIYAYFG